MGYYSICYEIVTPESAKNGDSAEDGFLVEQAEFHAGDLRSIIAEARSYGCIFDGSSDWAYSVDPHENYRTGESTFYSFHVEGVSDSTWNRIMRAIGS